MRALLDQFDTVVDSLTTLARGVVKLSLKSLNSELLPAFEPGAHVDLYLPNGLVRSYSLINACPAAGTQTYELAIGLDPGSEGGSRYLHTSAAVGQYLQIGRPRNNFPLVQTSGPICLIGGGIGITPLRAMVHALVAQQRPWQLIYAARSRQAAAFVEELSALGPNVTFHFDDENPGLSFEPEKAIAALVPEAHVYCCGPSGLMERVKAACADWPSEQVHFEWFKATLPADAMQLSFVVELAQRGLRLEVPSNRSILEVLEDHDVIIPSVCKEGVCGTCECGVLAGDILHCDSVLTEAERQAGKTMMLCVSRARSGSLVLDL